MHQRLIVLFVPLLITLGCQTVKKGDTASPFFPPPNGSTVILHQDLEIPPQTARVFLQRGQTYGYYGFNRYYPWCYFKLNTVVDATQTLRADTFEVYRVVSTEEQVVENEPIRLAGVSLESGGDLQTDGALRLAIGGGDGPSTIVQVVQLWLRSEKQQDIRTMVCGGAEDNPSLVVPPSILQIQGALGSIATLKLPEQKDS